MQNFPFLHDIAVVAIVKNEGNYIKEWLDYHLLAGVTKFYIYDNDSNDNTREILRPYAESGAVQYIPFGGGNAQNPAYMDAIARHRFECRHMAIIDGDEFILPRRGKNIPAAVAEFFGKFPMAAAWTINWRVFGSSGQKEKDLSRGGLERFCRRASDDFGVGTPPGGNMHVKSIVNPRTVEFVSNPHFCNYFFDCRAADEKGKIVAGAFNPNNNAETMRINHYFTKSLAEWHERRSLGRADNPTKLPFEEFIKGDRNEVYDDEIIRYRDYLATRPPAMPPTVSTEDILAAAKGEGAADIENILCYFFALTKAQFSPSQKEELEKISLRELERAFSSGQQIWQTELFLSALPMLFAVSEATRAQAVRAAQGVLPKLAQVYRNSFDWVHYRETMKLMNLLLAMPQNEVGK